MYEISLAFTRLNFMGRMNLCFQSTKIVDAIHAKLHYEKSITIKKAGLKLRAIIVDIRDKNPAEQKSKIRICIFSALPF